MEDKAEFYKNLKAKLDEDTPFPTIYMYKFIVPTDQDQENEIKTVFKNIKSKINTKRSKTGKYISFSIVINAKSSDEVIRHYRSVEHIKGLVSL